MAASVLLVRRAFCSASLASRPHACVSLRCVRTLSNAGDAEQSLVKFPKLAQLQAVPQVSCVELFTRLQHDAPPPLVVDVRDDVSAAIAVPCSTAARSFPHRLRFAVLIRCAGCVCAGGGASGRGRRRSHRRYRSLAAPLAHPALGLEASCAQPSVVCVGLHATQAPWWCRCALWTSSARSSQRTTRTGPSLLVRCSRFERRACFLCAWLPLGRLRGCCGCAIAVVECGLR